MKNWLITLTLCVFWAGAQPALASEPALTQSTLVQENIQNIKIFSKDQNRIQFYLTDSNQQKYRIPNLSEDDATKILNHFKKGDTLTLSTKPNKRGYLDVVKWQKQP